MGPVFNLDDASGTDEGRAMAELIADIAPAADLSFHTATGGQAEFAEGLELRRGPTRLVVEDREDA